ncbi:flagellar hook assembly protein FlgD [Parvularcula sp. ZS-1/3]|uniref:Basal-body rod modification protein FlgD n=1 Tax=Parvularcula mediterranea TaxID=2732508 RepID=A0A7Y3W6K9_9PROT|nr:flagellar hook assembly protein FlgD [Parvularcula mediterranea]NNU17391.1 flagellar hook assembly protein FlgD [Parvularcula mediterranea]
MSTITPIAQTPTSVADETPSRASVARSALTDNLDTFLTLLTKQLQNQDPLQPMDTNQFVDQLTQFSELEQGVEQSATLEKIAASLDSDDRQTDLNLLGTVVEAENEQIALGDTPARFAFEINAPTDDAEMRIFDTAGNLVAKFDVEGDVGRYEAGWDGRTLDGGQAAPGLYRAQVVAKGGEQERLAGRILSGGLVEEVRFENGETRLILQQGMQISADDVRRVGLPRAA